MATDANMLSRVTIPVPQMAVPSRAPRRFPYVRTVVGGLALLGLAYALVTAVAANRDNDAYVNAPICATGSTGSDCVAVVPAVVNDADVDRSQKIPVGELDLGSLTPGVGHVTLDQDITFAEDLRTNDAVTVQLWHGKVVAVTAHNETVATTDAPALENTASVLIAIVCELIAFVMLRSASRARLASMLRRDLRRGPENRLLRLFGFTVVVVAVVGTFELAAGRLWGAIAVAVAFGAVGYSVVVPYLWRGNIRRW
jgi:hypothetical protein